MERFLETLLAVEREAAALEKDARERLLAIERRYRDGLSKLEAKSLEAAREEFERSETRVLEEADEKARAIESECERQVEILRKAARRVTEECADLVSETVLPGCDGPD